MSFERRRAAPLRIRQVHARSTQRHKWLVVLDAAAHAPTHPLDLGKHKADFVPLSFYKLFGLPTGECGGA